MPRDGTIEVAGTISGELTPLQNVSGNLSIPTERITPYIPYEGPYEVIPDFIDQTLETATKIMSDDVVVKEIPVAEVSNPAGGVTLTIG